MAVAVLGLLFSLMAALVTASHIPLVTFGGGGGVPFDDQDLGLISSVGITCEAFGSDNPVLAALDVTYTPARGPVVTVRHGNRTQPPASTLTLSSEEVITEVYSGTTPDSAFVSGLRLLTSTGATLSCGKFPTKVPGLDSLNYFVGRSSAGAVDSLEFGYLNINPTLPGGPSWIAKLRGDSPNAVNATLGNLTLPGSRGSASFNLTGPLRLDLLGNASTPAWLSATAKLWNVSEETVVDWWVTFQPNNITDQLQSGIRYFDIPVVWDPTRGQWFVYSIVKLGGPVASYLSEIREFLLQHPDEIVVVYLTTKSLGGAPGAAELRSLSLTVADELTGLLFPADKGLSQPLGALWANNWRTLVVVDNAAASLAYPWIWPNSTLNISATSTQNVTELVRFANATSLWFNANKPLNDQLLVLVWGLGPANDFPYDILADVHSPVYTRALLADVANARLSGWVAREVALNNTYPFLANALVWDDALPFFIPLVGLAFAGGSFGLAAASFHCRNNRC